MKKKKLVDREESDHEFLANFENLFQIRGGNLLIEMDIMENLVIKFIMR
jgi:hypothetical protein